MTRPPVLLFPVLLALLSPAAASPPDAAARLEQVLSALDRLEDRPSPDGPEAPGTLFSAGGGAERETATPAGGLPRLTGIVIAPGSRHALLVLPAGTPRRVREGERLGGWTLHRILPGGVELDDGRIRRFVPLRPSGGTVPRSEEREKPK